ncbi:hypothetical protein CASFOL_031463 [Castilleja foliolosa]|uniref:Uncharacterized protein n=1 Tax=Castilleja foliolosa TaxID=1961234 RepID=A0ABD3C4S2_9LAMI
MIASWTELKPKLEKVPQGRAANPHLDQSDLEKLFREHVKTLYEVRVQAAAALAVLETINFCTFRENVDLILVNPIPPCESRRRSRVNAGLPPEEKPRLCDDACDKEHENVLMVTTESGLQYKDIKVCSGPSPPVGFQVAANCVAMVPSGQIFDRV